MTDAEFLQEVKRSVLETDPEAEVCLFGSCARVAPREDSDWNFLVLTDELVDRVFKRRLRDHLYDLELDSERMISTIIQNRAVWKDLAVTDLHQNIREDGITV